MLNIAKMPAKKEVNCELHCHTSYSWDCDVPVNKVIEYALAKNVDVLAITDHNEIKGALEALNLAPNGLRIIIGEEISTLEGHIIGLFIKDKIEPHQSAKETILQIKKQGGVVLVPHAFDRLRGGIGAKHLHELKGDIDFLEVFNARVLIAADNVKALNFAKEHGMASYVGSDGHTRGEYGNALNTIDNFDSQTDFVLALKRGKFTTKLSGFKVYVLSEYVKLKKKIIKLLGMST